MPGAAIWPLMSVNEAGSIQKQAPRAVQPWMCGRTMSLAEVKSLANASIPKVHPDLGLYLNDTQYSHLRGGMWSINAEYGRYPMDGASRFSFQTTGGTAHITQARWTQRNYGPITTGSSGDTRVAIEVDGETFYFDRTLTLTPESGVPAALTYSSTSQMWFGSTTLSTVVFKYYLRRNGELTVLVEDDGSLVSQQTAELARTDTCTFQTELYIGTITERYAITLADCLPGSGSDSGSESTDPPDCDGAIGVDGEGNIAGTDITIPFLSFTETHKLPPAAYTCEYIALLTWLTGKVNSERFRFCNAGECLFMGASGAYSPADEFFDVTFQFSVSVNEDFLKIGDIAIPDGKLGWQYLWVRYKEIQQGAYLVKKPASVHVADVYEYADFSLLGIGERGFGGCNLLSNGSGSGG